MAEFLAIHQTDAALLGCLLRQLAGKAPLGEPGEAASGVGYVHVDDVLLRKRPLQGRQAAPEKLAEGLSSEAVIVSSGTAIKGARGAFSEDTAFPFRFRRWLFSLSGNAEALQPARVALHESIPDHLRRSVKSEAAAESLFFTFLTRLREAGRLDDSDVDAETAAKALAGAVGAAERAFEQLGQPTPPLAAVVSNGRVMAAVRRGHPLFVRVQEGLQSCARCEIGPEANDIDPKVKGHRMLKAVYLASGQQPAVEGFRPLEDGEILAVSRKLDVVRVR